MFRRCPTLIRTHALQGSPPLPAARSWRGGTSGFVDRQMSVQRVCGEKQGWTVAGVRWGGSRRCRSWARRALILTWRKNTTCWMWGFPEIQLRPNQLWQQMWIFHYFFFLLTRWSKFCCKAACCNFPWQPNNQTAFTILTRTLLTLCWLLKRLITTQLPLPGTHPP